MEDQLLLVEEELENRFLYQNDLDSIHILLSMIDHQHKRSNLQPRYQLMKQMTATLKRMLSYRKDKGYIIQELRRRISDDVNRFEFAVVLKGYAAGTQSAYYIDRLERLALDEFTPEQLQDLPELYHGVKSGRVMGLQSDAFHHLRAQTHGFKEIRRLTNLYSKKVLRRKVLQLNTSLAAQIVVDFNDPSHLRVEEGDLNLKELNLIYAKMNRSLCNNVAKVYKYAFWNGLNDAVLERYQ